MSDKSTYKRMLSQSTNEKPKYSYQDMLAIRERGEQQTSEAFTKHHDEHASKSITGRSGILPMHQNCSLENYVVNCQGQNSALAYAQYFVNNFHLNNGSSFIFSGTTGTGKNHLSAAICNTLMEQGKRCLVITVSELMMRLNACYSDGAKMTEEQFFDGMVKLDLLVIDEIGLGRTSVNASNNEKLALIHIIDKRLCHLRPTGILTNLGQQELTEQLGVRVMRRLRHDGGQWVKFDWNEYVSQG